MREHKISVPDGVILQHQTSENFDRNARLALRDEQLRGALDNLANTFGERRLSAIGSVDNWEALREKARKIKDETLRNLDSKLEQFTKNAEKAGAQIHWAVDGAEACKIILGLIRERGSENVVKAKSMVSEEIRLNEALGKAGIF
ncbi:MAG TPA: LUD domain-containing protein, partial [Pyrinomonadaceae bacterium]|nr:LUD domain-containing protein [Pyrinomonadaceae bacterium]